MAESQNIDDRDWLLLKLEEHPGTFLDSFIKACLAADMQNWNIILPALQKIRTKYPLQKKRLEESSGQ